MRPKRHPPARPSAQAAVCPPVRIRSPLIRRGRHRLRTSDPWSRFMARIAHLAYLLVAVGTLPALAQSGYSEPPLPGDASEAWDAPPEPFDEVPEAEDEEGEYAEQVPGAPAGPAIAAVACDVWAYT